MLAMIVVATVGVFVLTGSGPRPASVEAPKQIGEFKRDRRNQTSAARGPSSAWMVAALADARARTMAGGPRQRSGGQRQLAEAVPDEIIEDATTRVLGR